MVNAIDVIKEFYAFGSDSYDTLVRHGEQVAQKALGIADKNPQLGIDCQFVLDAAILHDIGICKTGVKAVGGQGALPYICHGVQGRNMLDVMGFHELALVCERHVGAGISLADVVDFNLPLPLREMLPLSIEEKLVCYADKFFSKTPEKTDEKPVEKIVEGLARFGKDKVDRFLQFDRLFNPME